MKLLLVLSLALFVSGPSADASARLTEPERAAVFVIREEATDYALEAREDVCVELGTESKLREKAVLATLHEEGFKFHDGTWCNRGPRGVTVSIEATRAQELAAGAYEYISSISDLDPIRLHGDHFATLLRKSKYIIKCDQNSEPVVDSYHMLCCEKSSSQSKKVAH
jgi:hypothetical protein